jgi:hypothetical protein
MRRRRLRDDPVAFRVKYALLVQRLHEVTDQGDDAPAELKLMSAPAVREAVEATKRLGLAHEEGLKRERSVNPEEALTSADADPIGALALFEASERELRRLGWAWVGSEPPWYRRWLRRRQSSGDRRLGAFLDRVVEPAAVVVFFSCLVESRQWEPQRFLPKRTTKRRLRRRSPLHRWHQDRSQWLDQYLDILREPERRKLWWPWRFVAWLGLTAVRPVPPTNYRVRYNLACLYSRLAHHVLLIDGLDDLELVRYQQQFLAEAATHLSLCFTRAKLRQRDAIAQWARKDPALATLRLDEEERFFEIVGRDE